MIKFDNLWNYLFKYFIISQISATWEMQYPVISIEKYNNITPKIIFEKAKDLDSCVAKKLNQQG